MCDLGSKSGFQARADAPSRYLPSTRISEITVFEALAGGMRLWVFVYAPSVCLGVFTLKMPAKQLLQVYEREQSHGALTSLGISHRKCVPHGVKPLASCLG